MRPVDERSWLVWLALTLGGFTVLERKALLQGDVTLTRALRTWGGYTPLARRGRPVSWLLAALLVWFWGHIVRGWRP